MKIKAIIIAAFCLMSLSCRKEVNELTPEVSEMQFRATLDVSTKTSLSGTMVRWEPADKLSLWYGTLGTGMEQSDYSVGSIETDARYATLNGFAKPSDDYVAVYPRTAALECSKDGDLALAFPAEQAAIPGSFASGANVSVAYSGTTDLGFRNVGGLLALKVTSAGGHIIKKIRLTGTAAMAGEVSVLQTSIAAGEPAVDAVNEHINFLTLDCGDGLKDMGEDMGATEIFFEEPGTWAATKSSYYTGGNLYYLVCLPGSHTGFVLTIVDSEGKTAVAKSTYSYNITRNSNTVIASISAPADPDKWKADPKVFINEVDCKSKRIELFNPNAEDVDLSGWILRKDEKSWAFPVGSTVPAGGYLVVNCKQSDCSLGPTFGISGDKGFVLSLVNGTVVDCVDNSDAHAQIGEAETYGRKTDGSSEWVIFSTGTIFESGVCDGDNSKGTIKGDEPAAATVVLNEINGNDKYAELYNKGAETVDITGWTLHKDDSKVWTASDESQLSLAPGAYMVINFVKKSKDPKEAASGLSAGKTVKVELKDKSGASVDVFTRGEESTGWGDIDLPEHEDWSFSRVPNGTGAWKYALPTKGAANGEKTGTIEQYPAANGGVVLNELNGSDKFIELYNTSTDYPISLEDMTLYKDDGTEAIWTGAPGLSIAPEAYLLLYSEDKKTPETYDGRLIFHSGLSEKKTLKIEMKAADGTSSVDCFTRGAQPWGTKISECTDSYGRTPDGTGSWKLIDKTPGSANGDSKGNIPQN